MENCSAPQHSNKPTRAATTSDATEIHNVQQNHVFTYAASATACSKPESYVVVTKSGWWGMQTPYSGSGASK